MVDRNRGEIATHLVVGASVELPIGFRGKGILDEDGNMLPDQPWIVVRRATREEWVAGGGWDHDCPWTHFYGILTD